MLLLCALIVGSGSVWAAENDTHDFSQSLSQLLNNNASIPSITIDQQSYPVKEVIVSYSYNKNIENAPVFRAPLPQILNYPKNQAVVCRKVGKVSDPC